MHKEVEESTRSGNYYYYYGYYSQQSKNPPLRNLQFNWIEQTEKMLWRSMKESGRKKKKRKTKTILKIFFTHYSYTLKAMFLLVPYIHCYYCCCCCWRGPSGPTRSIFFKFAKE